MTGLVNYVQPLTDWLQNNPRWSLFITFIISLTESLVIIGTIIPGSVTMTALGILAGTGIMRVDLTFLAAILGAVAGDSLSYTLGYFYSERSSDMWPFSKYPKLLQYGKDFFATHGGKSVLIGRFVGPLRSIIPVIAGIMHMKHWRFFTANLISAIGWSILYLMPGILIGAASHGLSSESASNLFLLIITLLAGIWLLSFILQWLFSQLHFFLKRYLHYLWIKLKHSPLANLYNVLTPKNEKNHYSTALLALMALCALLSFIIILALTLKTQWLTYINVPTHLFMHSLPTGLLKAFFIVCSQLTCPTTLISLFILCSCYFIYHKEVTMVLYLSSLLILATLSGILLSQYIHSPRPPGLLVPMPGSSFLPIALEAATAFYGFILFYINQAYPLFRKILKILVFSFLGLSGLGTVYLGDYWLSDVLAAYCSGATLGLIYCLLYRRFNLIHEKTKHAVLTILLFLIIIITTTLGSSYFNFHTLVYNHTPYYKEFTLNEKKWWQQAEPILPLYQLSRIGKRISLLNIQYDGNIGLLQHSLEQKGWQARPVSFLINLLMRMDKKTNSVRLPLLTQLYENKVPVLIMTYSEPHAHLALELRMWQSNYNLLPTHRPLWIGSIHPHMKQADKKNMVYSHEPIDLLHYLLPTEHPFLLRRMKIPESMIKTTIYPIQPFLLLIKNQHFRVEDEP